MKQSQKAILPLCLIIPNVFQYHDEVHKLANKPFVPNFSKTLKSHGKEFSKFSYKI